MLFPAKSCFLAIAAASFMMFGAQASFAQPTEAEQAAMRSACPSDYRKYCSSIPPGGEASLQCLQENVAKLGSACQTAVNAVGKAPAASDDQSKSTTPPSTDSTTKANAAEPAATDAKAAPAKTAAPATKAAPANTTATATKAAPAAKTAPATTSDAKAAPAAPAEKTAKAPPMTLRQEIRLVRNSCGREFRELCAGVGLGGGRAIGCLEARKSSLSENCKKALQEARAQ